MSIKFINLFNMGWLKSRPRRHVCHFRCGQFSLHVCRYHGWGL